jgi:hypothetical protein
MGGVVLATVTTTGSYCLLTGAGAAAVMACVWVSPITTVGFATVTTGNYCLLTGAGADVAHVITGFWGNALVLQRGVFR